MADTDIDSNKSYQYAGMAEYPPVITALYEHWDRAEIESQIDPQNVTNEGRLNVLTDAHFARYNQGPIRGKDCNGLNYLILPLDIGNIVAYQLVGNFDDVDPHEDEVNFINIEGPDAFFELTGIQRDEIKTREHVELIFGGSKDWNKRLDDAFREYQKANDFEQNFQEASVEVFNQFWETCQEEFSEVQADLEKIPETNLHLEPGQVMRGEDDRGRRILVQGTPYGNLVVVQRYEDPKKDGLVAYAPAELNQIFFLDYSVSTEKFELLFSGVPGKNVGNRLNDLIYQFNLKNSKGTAIDADDSFDY